MDRRNALQLFPAFAAALYAGTALAQAPVLPSWNEGSARTRIIEFVRAVSDPSSKDFVAPGERIAVFDNDGGGASNRPSWLSEIPMAICRCCR